MDLETKRDREVRAAKNQVMFREVNERIRDVNETFEAMTERYAIVCECCAPDCVARIELRAAEYEVVRSDGNRFVVAPGHVDFAVEEIAAEHDGYVVVRKLGAGETIALDADPRGDDDRR